MKLKNIDKSIQKQDILQGISLEVSPQKLTAFIGPNGAGKSTLLSIMSRLTKKDQGILSIKGREIESCNSQELAQELTILKQKINYQAKLTVEELISFGRFPYSRGRLRPEDWEKIRETLDYLELTNLKDRYIDSLSGGQLQRVFIAMVLAQDTDFILLDEPLNNLDIKQSVSMMQILKRLVEELGKTIMSPSRTVKSLAREQPIKSCRPTCSVNYMRFPSRWLISMAKRSASIASNSETRVRRNFVS